MKTIMLDELLTVMSKEQFKELKYRGKLIIAKRTPNTEIAYNSIPVEYRCKLDDARR